MWVTLPNCHVVHIAQIITQTVTESSPFMFDLETFHTKAQILLVCDRQLIRRPSLSKKIFAFSKSAILIFLLTLKFLFHLSTSPAVHRLLPFSHGSLFLCKRRPKEAEICLTSPIFSGKYFSIFSREKNNNGNTFISVFIEKNSWLISTARPSSSAWFRFLNSSESSFFFFLF